MNAGNDLNAIVVPGHSARIRLRRRIKRTARRAAAKQGIAHRSLHELVARYRNHAAGSMNDLAAARPVQRLTKNETPRIVLRDWGRKWCSTPDSALGRLRRTLVRVWRNDISSPHLVS